MMAGYQLVGTTNPDPFSDDFRHFIHGPETYKEYIFPAIFLGGPMAAVTHTAAVIHAMATNPHLCKGTSDIV